MTDSRTLPRPGDIRPCPYPFEAGLSISSDPDRADLAFLDELMRYLNSKQRTKFGEGLGLEVQSSLFHYSNNPHEASIWNGTKPESPASKDAHRLQEYLEAGYIDAFHAFGNFDGGGGFTRHHLEKVAAHINSLSVRVPGFTNHGGYENVQNVGADAQYHQGDFPGSAAYHSDQWLDLGIKYVWTDSMVYHDYGASASRAKSLRQSLRRNLERKVGPSPNYTPYFSEARKEVFVKISLQDGSQPMGFSRFRGTGANAPNLSSLGAQVREIPWDNLYSSHRWLILYQHLGVGYRLNGKAVPASIEMVNQRPEVFLEPFRFLRKQQEKGLLWIAGTSRLLDYLKLRESLSVEYRENGRVDLSIIAGNPQTNAFAGLTIYIDPMRFAGLFHAGQAVKFLPNGPDRSGLYSVTVPENHLPSIWE